MITFVKGNIFDSNCQTIVNPVNCVGVMGAGLALQFRNRYPSMFTAYKAQCNSRNLRIGSLYLYTDTTPWVLCFPSKDHWRDPSRLQYIESGLKAFVATYEDYGITSIAFPPIGAGLGGLNAADVKHLMHQYLADLPIRVDIYNMG